MNWISELEKYFTIEDVGEEFYVLNRNTPAYAFYYYVKPTHAPNRFLCVASRKERDDKYARNLIGEYIENQFVVRNGIAIFNINRPLSRAFDKFLVASPDYHDCLKVENAVIHQSVELLMPHYSCEFIGNETPEIFKLLRRDIVSTLDWSREPNPQFYMRFFNNRTNLKSVGSDMGLSTLESLEAEIKALIGATAALIEIRNYKKEMLIIESRDGVARVKYLDSERIVDSSGEVFSIAKKFLIKNVYGDA